MARAGRIAGGIGLAVLTVVWLSLLGLVRLAQEISENPWRAASPGPFVMALFWTVPPIALVAAWVAFFGRGATRRYAAPIAILGTAGWFGAVTSQVSVAT